MGNNCANNDCVNYKGVHTGGHILVYSKCRVPNCQLAKAVSDG